MSLLPTPNLPLENWWYRFCLYTHENLKADLKMDCPYIHFHFHSWVNITARSTFNSCIFSKWCFDNLPSKSYAFIVVWPGKGVIDVHNGGLQEGLFLGIIFENESDALMFKLHFAERIQSSQVD